MQIQNKGCVHQPFFSSSVSLFTCPVVFKQREKPYIWSEPMYALTFVLNVN